MSPVVRWVQLAVFTLPAFLVGVVLGLLFGYLRADWVEAVGTWFAGFVALFAVILAVIAFRSEDFARRLERARANRDERTKLQQDADLVVCRAGWSVGNEVEPGVQLAKQLAIRAMNGSHYMVTNVTYQIPQIDAETTKLAEVLSPSDEVAQELTVAKPFRVRTDNRELYEGVRFKFSLGGVSWVGRYAQPAERQDP
jgi:hypothetical protein